MSNDLNRLQVIFLHPQSIVALEAFNELIHRPSETMIESLMNLFKRSIQSQPHLDTATTTPSSLDLNPLFIIVLIKRIILDSHPTAPKQPSRSKLPKTFQDLFLPTFINLRFLLSPPHQALSDRLVQQFILSFSTLATRLIYNHYDCNLDPLAELIHSIQAFTSLDHGSTHPTHQSTTHLNTIFDCLKAIKEIVRAVYQSNSLDSASIFAKMTRNHFESLYSIYHHFILISLSLAPRLSDDQSDSNSMDEWQIYQIVNESINLLLKIFKMMVEPLSEMGSSYQPMMCLDHHYSSSSSSSSYDLVLNHIVQNFLSDFQNSLDSQLNIMNQKNYYSSTHQDQFLSNSNIAKLEHFDSYIFRYAEILLRIQSCRPSIITDKVLQVYLKIVEFVSNQIEISSQEVIEGDHHQFQIGSDDPLTSLFYTKGLFKFYPLLIQALKLMNNSLNPWNFYSRPGPSDSLEPSANINQEISPIQNLTPSDTHQLCSILQPLLNFKFDPETYSEGGMMYVDKSEESDQETIETIDEQMDVEDIDQDDDDNDEDVDDDEEDDDKKEEEVKTPESYQLDDEPNPTEFILTEEGRCLKKKFQFINLNPPPPPSHSHHHYQDIGDHQSQLAIKKQPLQIEIEELLLNLKINQN